MLGNKKVIPRGIVPDRVYACVDPQVGPHNHCRHPEHPPPGYVQCQGDPGCAVRVPRGARTRLCFWHADDAAVRADGWQGRLDELMGATP